MNQHETAIRHLSSAIAALAAGDVKHARMHVRIAVDSETFTDSRFKVPKTRPKPARDYASPRVPDATHQTVVGYLSAYEPELLDTMLSSGTAIGEATRRDGFWLSHRCRERSLRSITVPAPMVLMREGILSVQAWPLELLRERFG